MSIECANCFEFIVNKLQKQILTQLAICQTVALEEWLKSLTHGLKKAAAPKSILASLQTLQLWSDSCLMNEQTSSMTPPRVAKELLFNILPELLQLMSDSRDTLHAPVRKTLLAIYAAYQHWWITSGGDKYSSYGQLCHEMNEQVGAFLKSSNSGRPQVNH